jgi:hypothetical protein
VVPIGSNDFDQLCVKGKNSFEMGKKVKKKGKKTDSVDVSKTMNVVTEVDEKPYDFGGIPARDLKKNLGCG